MSKNVCSDVGGAVVRLRAYEGPDDHIVPELLTTAQAAKLAGVSERTWWAWTRSGLAPKPVKIGRGTRPAVRFRRSEVLAWIASGCMPVENCDA